MQVKNKVNNQTVRGAGVQGYHQGGHGSEAYAFMGFDGVNKYFTSDRFITLDSNYRRTDGKECKGYGIEFELESWGFTSQMAFATVLRDIVFPLFPKGLFKMQNDATLRGGTTSGGIEAITQIMTKEFIRNHYKDFKTMFNDYFNIFEISSSRSGNCGQHVNISNACFGKDRSTQAEAIRKFYYIINKHYDFCCALVNRRADRTTWCGRMYHDKSYVKTMDLNHMDGSHGNCFNGSHYNAGRIELRLVGGQDNYACFRNTMESIFFLVDRVKSISWDDVDDLSKIFKGCNQYVFDRIKSKCYERGTISTAQIDAIRSTVQREELI